MKFRAYTCFTKLRNKLFLAVLTHTDCFLFSTHIILKTQNCSVRHLMLPYFLKSWVRVLSPNSMEMHISFKFNNVKKENSNGTLKKIFSQLLLGYFRNRCTAFHEFLIPGQNALFPFLHVWFYFYSGVSGSITRKLFWYIIKLKIGILIYMEFYWDNISLIQSWLWNSCYVQGIVLGNDGIKMN